MGVVRPDGRLVVVGQAPSREAWYRSFERAMSKAKAERSLARSAILGRAGVRLASLVGWSVETWARRTRRFNVLPHYPGHNPGGDLFPLSLARAAATEMAPRLVGAGPVLLLGYNVARAFGVRPEYFVWRTEPLGGTMEAALWAVFPHPSHRNHWWNERGSEHRARHFLMGALDDATAAVVR